MFEAIPARKCHRRSHYVSVRFQPARGRVLARVLGRLLFGESGWARHYSDATATGRAGNAVGDFTARRRSAKVRLVKTSVAKRHALEKRTVFTTRRRTHMSGGGATWSTCAECANWYPCSGTKRFQNKCTTTVKETLFVCVYRPPALCLSGPHTQVDTENLKSEKQKDSAPKN